MKLSVARPEAALRSRALPRASVTGTATPRVIPLSATMTANRAVHAWLQLNRTESRWASAARRERLRGRENENRGGAGGRALVVNVRSAPTTVPPALDATSR